MADNTETTLTTLIGNEAAFPNATSVQPGEAIPTALVMDCTTVMAEIEGDEPTARIAYAGDAAANIVKEGEAISRDTPTISELVVSTQKVAVLTVVSRESYSHSGVPEMLGNGIGRGIVKKADALFFTGNPTGGKGIKGLAKQTGLADGGTLSSDLTPIIDAIATVSGNGADPTHIVMNMGAWAHLLKLKATDGRPLINPDVANSTQPQLFGLPVRINTQCPANEIYVLDRAEILSAVGTVDTDVSRERYFDSDSIGIRATFRYGFGLLHPNRLAKVTISTTTNEG